VTTQIPAARFTRAVAACMWIIDTPATPNSSCGASWNWLYNRLADEGGPELNYFKLRAM
jgi:hypothetical protein